MRVGERGTKNNAGRKARLRERGEERETIREAESEEKRYIRGSKIMRDRAGKLWVGKERF